MNEKIHSNRGPYIYYAQICAPKNPLDSDIAVEFQIQEILFHRYKHNRQEYLSEYEPDLLKRRLQDIPDQQLQFLVRWARYGEQSWQPGQNLKNAPEILCSYKQFYSSGSMSTAKKNNSKKGRKPKNSTNSLEKSRGRDRGFSFERVYNPCENIKMPDDQDEIEIIDRSAYLEGTKEATNTFFSSNIIPNFNQAQTQIGALRAQLEKQFDERQRRELEILEQKQKDRKLRLQAKRKAAVESIKKIAQDNKNEEENFEFQVSQSILRKYQIQPKCNANLQKTDLSKIFKSSESEFRAAMLTQEEKTPLELIQQPIVVKQTIVEDKKDRVDQSQSLMDLLTHSFNDYKLGLKHSTEMDKPRQIEAIQEQQVMPIISQANPEPQIQKVNQNKRCNPFSKLQQRQPIIEIPSKHFKPNSQKISQPKDSIYYQLFQDSQILKDLKSVKLQIEKKLQNYQDKTPTINIPQLLAKKIEPIITVMKSFECGHCLRQEQYNHQLRYLFNELITGSQQLCLDLLFLEQETFSVLSSLNPNNLCSSQRFIRVDKMIDITGNSALKYMISRKIAHQSEIENILSNFELKKLIKMSEEWFCIFQIKTQGRKNQEHFKYVQASDILKRDRDILVCFLMK